MNGRRRQAAGAAPAGAASASTGTAWGEVESATTRPLEEDLTADVCVVGGGIAGVTTAYLLSRAGARVVLLEARGVGDGDSGRTTAHLSSALDDGFEELERLHGPEATRLAFESHQKAIEEIAAYVEAEEIACDLRRLDGYLFLGPDQEPGRLDRELAAARRAGADCERLAAVPGVAFASGPCLRYPRQGRFHPMKYLVGLAAATQRHGGRIFTASRVVDSEAGADGVVAITAQGHRVSAGSLVVATNAPIRQLVSVHPKQAPFLTYVVAAPVRGGTVPDALYWDTADPYHYVRLQPLADGRDLVICGGEDHPSGGDHEPAARFARLADWCRQRFGTGEPELRWSGQVMEPVDGLAYIGRNAHDSDRVFVATGDSGQGMTHGTLAGALLTALVLGRRNDWTAIYDPARVRLRALPAFVAIGLDVARRFGERVAGAVDVDDADEVPAGEGRVVRRRGRPVALYRDREGVLHARSAVCTHLGCVVHWNPAEGCWDCPCHGSRFAPHGEVVHGPAVRDLGPASR